jgi:hypothetical protein
MLKKITKEKEVDKSLDPVLLDSDQIQELDKLIGILKKEIIHPGKKTVQNPVSSGTARD